MSPEGKIVAIVGNTGVGKTTLARLLGAYPPFRPLLEEHEERPFQRLFAEDRKRFALANQVDYLLYRAEQERAARQQGGIGIQDGGLELDFRVFTRLFFEKGYLTDSELGVCERLYASLRAETPPPDILVWLKAPLEAIADRFVRRGRALSIADLHDLERMDALLCEWLGSEGRCPVMHVDAGQMDPRFAAIIGELVGRISTALGLQHTDLWPGSQSTSRVQSRAPE